MSKNKVMALMLLLIAFSASAQKQKTTVRRAPIDTSRFVLVEGGTFNMGTEKPANNDQMPESPMHSVSVRSFYLAKTETTFDEYDKFCAETKRDTAPSGAWGRGKQPAFMLTWDDAIAYCNWMSEKEKLSKCYLVKDKQVTYLDTAKGYRLPTEAEWEFAAHGGNKSKGTNFAGSNDISAVGWYKENSGGRSMPVKQKAPNELGLYDMTGNLWEWVWDFYGYNYYTSSPANDPKGPETGDYRVMRGGAWYNEPKYARIQTRQNHNHDFRQNSVGFRVARTYF